MLMVISCSIVPTLPELLRLKLPQRVGIHYLSFGVFLLNDNDGTKVQNLDHQHRGNTSHIVGGILQEWLQGRGLPVTWQSLTQALRDSDMTELADEVAAKYLAP